MIRYIDRVTRKEETEEVYGEAALNFLYQNPLGRFFRHFICRIPLFSALYGLLQKMPWTKCKVKPFIKRFKIDPSEFVESNFPSFQKFFIRKLKKEARPISKSQAVMPADGRYLFYKSPANIVVKGKTFDLPRLLQDEPLAKRYAGGSVVLARLCPSDYHRFHFPCDGIPSQATPIRGYLYSVNPIAIRENIDIFVENKRMLTKLQTKDFGEVLLLEVGATNVGSINQTYAPNHFSAKGDEKGYFAFGSALILLFEPGKMHFDSDLLAATERGLEIRCLMGQSMGVPV